jgi:hypothetical protein
MSAPETEKERVPSKGKETVELRAKKQCEVDK